MAYRGSSCKRVNATKVLLFDLGGVLLENRTFDVLGEWLPKLGEAEIRARWLASDAVRAFERGRIDPREFGERFVAEWGLNLTVDDFLREFATWPTGFYPGAEAALRTWRQRYRVCALSNANAIHWARFNGFAEHFDHAFSSHLIGKIKPDRDVFDHVIVALGVPPEAILFFDDSLPNVTTARSVGMCAEHAVGFEAVQALIAR